MCGAPGESDGPMTACAYHPDREAVGMCVSCGRAVCPECKVVLANRIHCEACANERLARETSSVPAGAHKRRYSRALRVISLLIGLFILVGVPLGLTYYLESGLVAVLLVEVVNVACGVLLVVAGIFPGLLSRIGIPIEKKSRFGALVAILVIVTLVATAFQPEPPGGWWTYGLDPDEGGAQWAAHFAFSTPHRAEMASVPRMHTVDM